MKTPRILFIAPSSYPIYGAEANVNAKVIKLLTEAGCIVDLIGRAPRATIKFYPHSKETLFFEKLNSINIVEVDTAKDIKTIVRHIKTYFKTGYVYKGSDWTVEAIKICDKLINENSYDYIYTYDYPAELVGLYLTKKYSIKWVSTWNDPYIWNRYPAPYGGGPSSNISYSRQKLISEIGKYAYRNVFPSQRLKDYMLGYMTNMKNESCVIIPHILLEELESKNKIITSDTLKIIHAGALGKERDPKTLLYGLKMFLEKKPDAKIEFSFLGIFERAKGDYFSDLIEECNLSQYITKIPPVSYAESLEIVKNYDVCMLIEAACEVGIFLPSKVIDYMQNNKPILAISPANGVIHDMYVDQNIDYFADVTQINDISVELEKLYTDFEKNTLGISNKNCDYYKNENIISIHRNSIFK